MSEKQVKAAGTRPELCVLQPLPTETYRSFPQWSRDFICRGQYETRQVPDVDARIDDILRLPGLLPPADQWRRPVDQRLLHRDQRYLRGRDRRTASGEHVPRGEHLIEHTILGPDPAVTRTTSLGLPLVDGVNAVPLARDRGGGRAGNVEADMLLLVDTGPNQQLQLVEVKAKSNNAWFAVVESLRQLVLFEQSEIAQQIMVKRRGAPAGLRPVGMVLAPPAFYTAKGKKHESIIPAQRLIRRAEERLELRCVLAVWDEEARAINLWEP